MKGGIIGIIARTKQPIDSAASMNSLQADPEEHIVTTLNGMGAGIFLLIGLKLRWQWSADDRMVMARFVARGGTMTTLLIFSVISWDTETPAWATTKINATLLGW